MRHCKKKTNIKKSVQIHNSQNGHNLIFLNYWEVVSVFNLFVKINLTSENITRQPFFELCIWRPLLKELLFLHYEHLKSQNIWIKIRHQLNIFSHVSKINLLNQDNSTWHWTFDFIKHKKMHKGHLYIKFI